MIKRYHKDGMIDDEIPVDGRISSVGSSLVFWILCLCLGSCLAAHESAQYTALWTFATKTTVESLVALSVVLVVGLTIVAIGRRNGLPLAFCFRAFVVLMLVQCIAILIKGGMELALIPSTLSLAQIVLQETSFFALPLLCPIAYALGVRNVTQLFMAGFAIAGAIQVIFCILLRSAAIMLVTTLPVISIAALAIALRMGRVEGGGRRESGDVFPAPASSEGLLPILACGAILLFAALLIDTNEARMILQDGGGGSRALQLVAGVSSFVAAIFLFIVDRRYMSEVTICLCCFFALPVMLGALYASSLTNTIGAAFLVAVLHRFGYAIMFYLMACFSRLFSTGVSPQVYFLLCFLATRLGWALGLLAFAGSADVVFDTIASVSGLIMLGATCAIVVFWMIRKWASSDSSTGIVTGSEREETALAGSVSNDVISAESAPVDILQKASFELAGRYGLTPREMDVFMLLARGRTAGHIQKALCISDGTTRTHMNHIYRKLGINSHEELMDLVDAAIGSSSDDN